MAWHDKCAPNDKQFNHALQKLLSGGAVWIHITVVMWGKIFPHDFFAPHIMSAENRRTNIECIIMFAQWFNANVGTL